MYCCSFAPLGKSPRACPRHLRRRFRGRAQGSNLPRCLPLSCNRGRGGSGGRCSRACGWYFLNRSLGTSAFAMPHAREYRRSQPCSKRNSAQIRGHRTRGGHGPCTMRYGPRPPAMAQMSPRHDPGHDPHPRRSRGRSIGHVSYVPWRVLCPMGTLQVLRSTSLACPVSRGMFHAPFAAGKHWGI